MSCINVNRQAKFEFHSLNVVIDITIVVQVKTLSLLKRVVTLNGGQFHCTEKRL